MNLPPLFEFDDWLYVAQCLRFLANQQVYKERNRAVRIADRIEEMLRQDNNTSPSSIDCSHANPCHHCSECCK